MAETKSELQALYEAQFSGMTDKEFNKALRKSGLTREDQRTLSEMRARAQEESRREFEEWAKQEKEANIKKYGGFKSLEAAVAQMKKDGLTSFQLENAVDDLTSFYKGKEDAKKNDSKTVQKKGAESTATAKKNPDTSTPTTRASKNPENGTKKPAHWEEYQAQGDSKGEVKKPQEGSKSLLENIDRSLSIDEKGKMTFHKRTMGEDGKVISEDFTRRTTKPLQEGSRFTREDLLKAIESVKNGKIEMATSKDSEPITLEVKNGQLSRASLKAFNKGLAAATKTILPPEKEISSDKKGWFGVKEERIDENGNIVKVDSKTQLAEEKREGFTQENEETAYYGISKFDLIDTKKEEIVKEKKTGIPKWVKAVAIGGAVVAGVVVATGVLAPVIMPAMSTLWHVAEAGSAIRPILHGINVGLAGLNGALGLGGMSFAAGTGVWTGAFGALNATAASAGLGSAIAALAGATGLIGAGGFAGGKLVQKLLNIGKKDKDKDKGTPAAETPVQPESKDQDQNQDKEAGEGRDPKGDSENAADGSKGGTGGGSKGGNGGRESNENDGRGM